METPSASTTAVRRRGFVIHVFAGLATAACHRENSAAPPGAQTPATHDTPAVAPSPIAMPVAAQADASSGANVSADAVAPSTDATVAAVAAVDEAALLAAAFHDHEPLVGTGGSHGTGEGTIGLGNLGVIGHGASGYGRMGGGTVNRSSSIPRVDALPSTVTGALSLEAIRRVNRRNIGQVRFCYEQGLAQRPNFRGHVVVRYIIGPTGSVLAAGASDSDLVVRAVAECTAAAVRRWMFPAPTDGANARVMTTFVFDPA